MAEKITDTWLVIPLYNEEPVIAQVVREAREVFPFIICVDDGSRDNSAAEASAAGAYVVKHPVNLGQGAALQTGIEFVLNQTDAKYLVTFDADGQHQVSDALMMRNTAEEKNLGIVFGSRFRGTPVESGWLKRITLQLVAYLSRHRTGLHLTDAHNGLRLLRRDAAGAVNLTQNQMAHASQIMGQLAATKLPYEEVPVHIRYTDYSRAKGQSLLNSINIVVDLLFR
ncbi:glycosyl transferase [Boudabousia liubingyangii]|uniref:Glycosyl transferase n=1 Tax=Boudabousia liubingyangii TaxID=1921764 RepID=A0A1Q5PPZ0_9ACTO|nr:glycosyltransferase family 2 protein [Boudabousia liubingyangii]OKL48450.1 glycosyl transferase [Boudabousia liubingyangii]OKL49520.1 glycosyl transferase [Boudabousia liubingyangii]